jgi:hypothetical protein
VRVHDVGLEVPSRAHRASELGSEEAEQRQLCPPGILHLRVHVAGVRQLLVAAGGVSKPFDRDAVEAIGGRQVIGRRGDDVHVHAVIAERDGELQDERAGGVTGLPRERVREKKRAHEERSVVRLGSLFLDAPAQLADLGTLHRDLVADQARREEHAADDEARLDDRPHGAGPDAQQRQSA